MRVGAIDCGDVARQHPVGPARLESVQVMPSRTLRPSAAFGEPPP